MTQLSEQELENISGGKRKNYPSKTFKCLKQNCGAKVIGSTFDGVHYEGVCQACGIEAQAKKQPVWFVRRGLGQGVCQRGGFF